MICFSIFFFNDTATTEIYTLSLHDALPISVGKSLGVPGHERMKLAGARPMAKHEQGLQIALAVGRVKDRKSTRLNSSHANISYAVFCLKKKKKTCKQYESPHHQGSQHEA